MGKQRARADDVLARLSVFDLQAELGMTKHMGGQQATEELVELCFIDESTSVLDVGCGVGLTARYLAEEICCAFGEGPFAFIAGIRPTGISCRRRYPSPRRCLNTWAVGCSWGGNCGRWSFEPIHA